MRKLLFVSNRFEYIAAKSTYLSSSYYSDCNLRNYNLVNMLNLSTDLRPSTVVKFWYLFLIHKQLPYVEYPEKSTNKRKRRGPLTSKAKGFHMKVNKKAVILEIFDFLLQKVMPFVDEDYQSISSLNQPRQTLRLGNCTTPGELYPLVLRTNVIIDQIKLTYIVNLLNQEVAEMFKFPVEMLIRSNKIL